MGKTLLVIALVFILGLGGLYLVTKFARVPRSGDGPTGGQMSICTADAKVCDDGSSVGRDPRHECEFYPCPVAVDTTREAPTACTMEAKICADGSAVGREGDRHCAFAACPGEGTVVGSVTLEGTCQYAETTGDTCETSNYDGEIRIEPAAGGKVSFAEVYDGVFHATLATGTYEVSSGRALPRCEGSFTVEEKEQATFSVACVAGYR
jgi:hypothetical protein